MRVVAHTDPLIWDYMCPMTRKYKADVAELLAKEKWSILDDFTEQLSGEATPVLKVQTSSGPALLRYAIEESQLQAYKNLAKSSVTPNLLQYGNQNGEQWGLIEWIEGTPIVKTGLSGSEVRKCILEIVSAATSLYVCEAPEDEIFKRPTHAREAEDGFKKIGLLDESGPPVAQIISEVGNPYMALHGDLFWGNVLRTSRGMFFIDPTESYGPREKDLTWMVAAEVAEVVSHGKTKSALSMAEKYIESIHESVEFLTEESLRAWISVGLVYDAYLRLAYGISNITECQKIVRVGGILYNG